MPFIYSWIYLNFYSAGDEYYYVYDAIVDEVGHFTPILHIHFIMVTMVVDGMDLWIDYDKKI